MEDLSDQFDGTHISAVHVTGATAPPRSPSPPLSTISSTSTGRSRGRRVGPRDQRKMAKGRRVINRINNDNLKGNPVQFDPNVSEPEDENTGNKWESLSTSDVHTTDENRPQPARQPQDLMSETAWTCWSESDRKGAISDAEVLKSLNASHLRYKSIGRKLRSGLKKVSHGTLNMFVEELEGKLTDYAIKAAAAFDRGIEPSKLKAKVDCPLQRLILHGVARYYGMSSSSAGTVKKRVTTIVAHRHSTPPPLGLLRYFELRRKASMPKRNRKSKYTAARRAGERAEEEEASRIALLEKKPAIPKTVLSIKEYYD